MRLLQSSRPLRSTRAPNYEWHKIRPVGCIEHPETCDWLQSFTIITTDLNELMESIHTRMPVILHPRNYALA